MSYLKRCDAIEAATSDGPVVAARLESAPPLPGGCAQCPPAIWHERRKRDLALAVAREREEWAPN